MEKQKGLFDNLEKEIEITIKEMAKLEKRAIKAEKETDLWKCISIVLVLLLLGCYFG